MESMIIGLDLIVKSTAVLTLAAVACLFLRNQPAAIRHRIWGLAFGGLILLPLLTVLLPAWRLPILPPNAVDLQANAAITDTPEPQRIIREMPPSPVASVEQTLAPQPQRLEEPALVVPSVSHEFAEVSVEEPMNVAKRELSWSTMFGGLWLAGLCLTSWPLLFSVIRNRRLQSAAEEIGDADEAQRISQLSSDLGLNRSVQLLETSQSIIPMTWGILNPILLFPKAWRSWTDQRRRLVLLHELAHVKRFDVAHQLVARWACVLYWFHPLAWYALRRLRIERELACDDCVLMAGARPSEYAKELLEIARHYQTVPLATAVAMAQGTSLEQRIRSLLDAARSHMPLGRNAGRVLFAMAVIVVVGIAVIRPGMRAGESETKIDIEESKLTPDDTDATKVNLHGVVRSTDTRSIPNASIIVVLAHRAVTSSHYDVEILGRTRTDSDGLFQVNVSPHSDRFSNGRYLEIHRVRIYAMADGFGITEHQAHPNKPDQHFDLELPHATKSLEGRILDLEGNPVSGVKIRVQELNAAGSLVDEWARKAANNPTEKMEEQSYFGMRRGKDRQPIVMFPASSRVHLDGLAIIPPVKTDANGRFEIHGIGDDHLAIMRIDGPGIVTSLVRAVLHDMSPVPEPVSDPSYRTGLTYGRKFDYTAEPSQVIQGVIRDAETGKPIPNVTISLSQYSDSLLSIHDFLSATTDEFGRYQLDGIPKSTEGGRGTRLEVLPAHDLPYFRRDITISRHDVAAAVTEDIVLKRAVWVKGQITDAKTGDGVAGIVSYHPFRNNPHAEEFEAYSLSIMSMGDDDLYATDESGRFQIPGMPGRGVVSAIAQYPERYKAGIGEKEIAGLTVPPTGNARGDTLNRYELQFPKMCNAAAEITAGVDDVAVECPIQVVPMQETQVLVVDEAGQPVTGIRTGGRYVGRQSALGGRGIGYWDEFTNDKSAEFMVVTGDPSDSERTLVFYHEERELGAFVGLDDLAGTTTGEAIRVIVRPLAKATARFVREDNAPATTAVVVSGTGTPLSFFPGSGKHLQVSLPGFQRLDSDGRVTFPVLPNGPSTILLLRIPDRDDLLVAEDFEAAPGETIDLGTINIDADPSTWPKPVRTKL